MKDARDALFVGHTTDGRAIRRPMSPHLQVYKPQLTSVLSIANRITGIAISAGTLLMVWWLVAAAEGPKPFAAVAWFAGSIVGVLLLLGWVVSLTYHTVAGVRHLAWDAGWGFDLLDVHRSGRLAIGATAALSLLVVVVGFARWL